MRLSPAISTVVFAVATNLATAVFDTTYEIFPPKPDIDDNVTLTVYSWFPDVCYTTCFLDIQEIGDGSLAFAGEWKSVAASACPLAIAQLSEALELGTLPLPGTWNVDFFIQASMPNSCGGPGNSSASSFEWQVYERDDIDRDGATNLADYAMLQRCLSPSGPPSIASGCEQADINKDGTVNAVDLQSITSALDNRKPMSFEVFPPQPDEDDFVRVVVSAAFPDTCGATCFSDLAYLPDSNFESNWRVSKCDQSCLPLTTRVSETFELAFLPAGTWTHTVHLNVHPASCCNGSGYVQSESVAHTWQVYASEDVNRSGDVTTADYNMVERCATGDTAVYLSPGCAEADVNNDGAINALDLSRVVARISKPLRRHASVEDQ